MVVGDKARVTTDEDVHYEDAICWETMIGQVHAPCTQAVLASALGNRETRHHGPHHHDRHDHHHRLPARTVGEILVSGSLSFNPLCFTL